MELLEVQGKFSCVLVESEFSEQSIFRLGASPRIMPHMLAKIFTMHIY